MNHGQWTQTRRKLWQEQESPELKRKRRKGSQRILGLIMRGNESCFKGQSNLYIVKTNEVNQCCGMK